VGMEVGPMEGLEFLALLMNRHKNYDKTIIVLPAKGDPFPPVAQRRDLASGRSLTEEIKLEDLERIILSALKGASPSAMAMPPAAVTPPAAITPPAAAIPPEADVPPVPDMPPAHVEPSSFGIDSRPLTPDKESQAVTSKYAAMNEVMSDAEPIIASAVEPTSEPLRPVEFAAPRTGSSEVKSIASAEIEEIQKEIAASRSRWPLFAVVAVILVAGAVGVVVLFSSSKKTQEITLPKKEAVDPIGKAKPEQQAIQTQQVKSIQKEKTAEPSKITKTAKKAEPQIEEIIAALSFQKAESKPSVAEKARLEAQLQSLKKALKEAPASRLEIGGHTSEEGDAEYNERLGMRRAMAAKNLLLQHGFPAERLIAKSYGSTRPLGAASVEDSKTQNRRVTLRLIH
jgi:outer membrane protein OmpA-like peptidoglycan-associated protein